MSVADDIGQDGVLDDDEVYLVELFPLDRSTSPPAVTALYLATRDVQFSTADPYAPAVEYDGRVLQALNFTRELWRDGRIGGNSLPAAGVIRVGIDDENITDGSVASWRGYAWDGRRVRVLRGRTSSDEYADYEVLLDGLLSGQNSFTATEISLGLSDLTSRLERPVHTDQYAGTGGFEGNADLKGVDKPWGIGTFRGVEPQQIEDPTLLWFDVDPINGLDPSVVPVVEDGGSPYTVTASNPPGSGQVYVDYGAGRVRLGTAPTKVLTVAAKSAFGAVGSPMLGASNAAELIEALLDLLGFTSGEIDAAALATLASANTYDLGRWYREAPRAVDVMDAIINSVAGYYTTSRGGQITFGVFAAPTATAETDSEIVFVATDADIVEGSLKVDPVASPPYRIEIGWGRSHRQLNVDDFVGSATEARREFLGTEYRYATASNTETQDEHLLSEPLVRDTMHDTEAGASALATLLAGLYAASGRQRVFLQLQLRPFGIEPAEQIWIRSAFDGVDMPVRTTGLTDNQANPLVDISGWR